MYVGAGESTVALSYMLFSCVAMVLALTPLLKYSTSVIKPCVRFQSAKFSSSSQRKDSAATMVSLTGAVLRTPLGESSVFNDGPTLYAGV